MYTYKNKMPYDLTVPGLGIVKANGEFQTPQFIESPQFELISGPDEPAGNSVVGTEAPQPNAVVDPTRVEGSI